MAPKLLPLALAALGLVGNAVALRPQGARRSARRPLRMVMDPSTLSLAVDPATIAPILAGKMAQLSQIAGSGASPSAALGLNELELLLGAGLGGGLVGAGVGATASNEAMKNEIEMLKGVRAELETQVGDLKAANAGLDEQLFQAEASYEKATGELQKEYENRVLRKLDELRKKLRGDFAKEKQELERKRLEDLKVAQARFEQEKETLRDAIDRAVGHNASPSHYHNHYLTLTLT
uniref:Uncharacterized protein n=1 Tax=Phaeomonas parva TaxID=124430 RepID=A0A7S1UE33_9STRA|mmetsp:Transcript_43578/g.136727  ORF Transcript_43578/g.136727 Transcript_43578/m.136727 type:complete len:235 (+) Transcript_43578:146-850(+)